MSRKSLRRWLAIERQRSQEALRAALERIQNSETRLRQVIDTIPTLAWCNLAHGPNEFLNKRWREFTGLSPEESNGWAWQAAFHPDDLPALMNRWSELLVSGESGEIKARLRRHDGVYRWFLIRVEPFRDESGKLVRWYGTSTDIEDLKQIEDTLREEERELRRITDAIPQAIIVLDPLGAPIYANQATLDYTGLPTDDVLSPDFRERIFHPDDVERLRDERSNDRLLSCVEFHSKWNNALVVKAATLVPDSIQSLSKRAGPGDSLVRDGNRH